jgi:hypothetical protein
MTMQDATSTASSATDRIASGYDRPDRPLAGYAAIMTGYGVLMASAAALLARRGRLAHRLGPGDALLLAVATHKLSRTLAKDAVASPLRAPFTRFKGAAGPGEVNEDVRGEGAQRPPASWSVVRSAWTSGSPPRSSSDSPPPPS